MNAVKTKKNEMITQQSNSDETNSSSTSTVDESSWTVQSTKRRLIPQWTLSRQDMGVDSQKNKNAQSEKPASNETKKKVIRFNKDELLGLRKVTKVLEALKDIPDIISIQALEPLTIEAFETEDFQRIWNLDRDKTAVKDNKLRNNVRTNATATTQRTKPYGANGEKNDDGNDTSWSRGSVPDHDNKDLWDDEGISSSSKGGGFDLADFAAAALKFHSTTRELALAEVQVEPGSYINQEDPIEKLLREQSDLDTFEEDINAGNIEEEDDEDMPDWAVENDMETMEFQDPVIPHVDSLSKSKESLSKRNLLLETLNLGGSKSENKITAATSEVQQPKPTENVPEEPELSHKPLDLTSVLATEPVIAPITSSLETIVADTLASLPLPVPVPAAAVSNPIENIESVEWLYLDPQQNVQGPFSSKSMRRWHEAGYFNLELPIKLKSWKTFYPLGAVYGSTGSAIDLAFRVEVTEPSSATPKPAASTTVSTPPVTTSQTVSSIINPAHNQRLQLIVDQQTQLQISLEQTKQRIAQVEQHRILIEQQKQQIILEQQRFIAVLEHQRQHQHFASDQQRQQMILDYQRHQQALAENKRQLGLIDVRNQQLVMEQQRQQSALDQQRQQLASLEIQKQHIVAEEQKRQQILLEQQRQQALEEQRQQAIAAEQKRKEMMEQQALAEQQRQLTLLAEQQRQQALAEQQRQQAALLAEKKRQQAVQIAEEQQQHDAIVEPSDEQRDKTAFLFQREEQLRVQNDSLVEVSEDVKMNSTIGSSVAPWLNTITTKDNSSLPLQQILKEEESKEKILRKQQSPPGNMSMQLKSLLGVNSLSMKVNSTANNANAKAWSMGPSALAPQPSMRSFRDIETEELREAERQQELLKRQLQQRQKQQQDAIAAANAHLHVNNGTPWTAIASPPTSQLEDKNLKAKVASLRDIMQEEIRTQVVSDDSNEYRQPKSASGSWAAKIGGGNSAPPKFTPSPSSSQPEQSSAIAAKLESQSETTDTSSQPSKMKMKGMTDIVSGKISPRSKAGNDFGGKTMSKDLAEWCMSCMRRINGSEDITLLQFCMTLDSAVEIREYLAAYLGSTPQISQFASEFIQRKEGGSGGTFGTMLAMAGPPVNLATTTNGNNVEKKVTKKKKSKNVEF